jgi:hypothetical protein
MLFLDRPKCQVEFSSGEPGAPDLAFETWDPKLHGQAEMVVVA